MVNGSGTRIIKNSVLSLFNTIFLLGTTWVISIWVARQLGPAKYGIFNLVLWFTGTASWAVGMGLTHAITKFIAEFNGKGEKQNIGPVILFVLKIEIVVTIVSCAILIGFSTTIADFFFSPQESFFFILAFIGLIPGVVTAIFSSAIDGIQKFEYFTYANLIITPLSFISKVIVLAAGLGINGLLVVMLVFSFINSIFYYFVLKKEGILSFKSGPISNPVKQRILRYNRSVLAILICDKIVWDKSENFFLGRFCIAAEVGFYNLGYNLAHRFTSILPLTFWRVLFPAMSTFFGSGNQDKMKRLFFLSTRYLAFIAFPIGTAGMMLSYQIIQYLYGSEYMGAYRVLQIIFVSSIFSSLSNPASAVLYGYEKQSFIYKYGAILAVVNIVLDIFLIPSYGAVGAAVCYGITTVLGSVGGLIYTCRHMELKYPVTSVAKILLASLLMGTTMKVVLHFADGIPGLLYSIIAGCTVYAISAVMLGSFVEEDFVLLDSIKRVLPGKTKTIITSLHGLLLRFGSVHM